MGARRFLSLAVVLSFVSLASLVGAIARFVRHSLWLDGGAAALVAGGFVSATAAAAMAITGFSRARRDSAQDGAWLALVFALLMFSVQLIVGVVALGAGSPGANN